MAALTAFHRRRCGTWLLAALALLVQFAQAPLAAAHHARMLDATQAMLEVCTAMSPASGDDRSGTHRDHSHSCASCCAVTTALPARAPLLGSGHAAAQDAGAPGSAGATLTGVVLPPARGPPTPA